MFTSSGDESSGTEFSELGEDDEFTWHQFHVEGWGAQDFEGHTPVAMHNSTEQAVPLTWLLLDSQLTVELIANTRMLLNILGLAIRSTVNWMSRRIHVRGTARPVSLCMTTGACPSKSCAPQTLT